MKHPDYTHISITSLHINQHTHLQASNSPILTEVTSSNNLDKIAGSETTHTLPTGQQAINSLKLIKDEKPAPQCHNGPSFLPSQTLAKSKFGSMSKERNSRGNRDGGELAPAVVATKKLKTLGRERRSLEHQP
jgi:hypothetical protein